MPGSWRPLANGLEPTRVYGDRDVVHPADGLLCRWHRMFREVKEGQQVAVADIEEEVG